MTGIIDTLMHSWEGLAFMALACVGALGLSCSLVLLVASLGDRRNRRRGVVIPFKPTSEGMYLFLVERPSDPVTIVPDGGTVH